MLLPLHLGWCWSNVRLRKGACWVYSVLFLWLSGTQKGHYVIRIWSFLSAPFFFLPILPFLFDSEWFMSSIKICVTELHHLSTSLSVLRNEDLNITSPLCRYVNLLNEHRRIILCGPTGTGKSFLALRLAEFLVLRQKGGMWLVASFFFQVGSRSVIG